MAVAADCADAEPVRGAHLDVYLRKLLGEAVVNRTVDDEGICTATSIAQTKCEAECCLSLAPFVVQPPVRASHRLMISHALWISKQHCH